MKNVTKLFVITMLCFCGFNSSFCQCADPIVVELAGFTQDGVNVDLLPFDPNCTCGSGTECREVIINFQDSSTNPTTQFECICVFTSVGLGVSEDYIDVFDPVTCKELNEVNASDPNIYTFACDEYTKQVKFIVCQGDDIGTQFQLNLNVEDCYEVPTTESCDTLDQTCFTESIDISTGVDYNNGSLLPIGSYTGGWQLVEGPDTSISYPKPGYVLTPNTPAWAILPGARYISPFANANNNESFSDPYVFEQCFCVCEDDTEVNIDLAALFDNFLEVGLYHENGGLIQQLINYPGPASTSTFNLPALTSNTTHTLSAGVYCLRAGLRNDGSVTMGMAIEANISGAGMIEPGCCSPYTIISGTVFEDTQCDSINDLSIDPGLAAATVSLYSVSGGAPIMTTTTDALGYYAFFDVPVGNYVVKQDPFGAYDISLGDGGIPVTMNPNSVVGDVDFGNCEPAFCLEECDTNGVDISTGVDYNTGNLLPIGSYTGGWQLIDGPDTNVTYPRPGFVLTPNTPAWDLLPGASYISPFPNANNNESFSEPYVFQQCFCVCEDETEVNIDLAALFDNFLEVGLYDEHGGLIQQLINYPGPASTSTFNLPALTSSTTHTLSTGIYCLRAGLRNDGSVTMGMAIEANIKGAGLIEPGCCNPYTIITGTVFEDTQCDSINNLSIDPGIGGATVSLCPVAGGGPIMTTTTDVLGYYSFFDVPVGNYLVKQTPYGAYDISLGDGGIPVNMNPNSVVGDIDFGNCKPAFCEEECDTDAVNISTGVDYNTGGLLPIGSYTGGWQLVEGPDTSLSYPKPGYVLTPNTPAWDLLPGANYISPFPNANNNESFSDPYVFEQCFCVCEDETEVKIDLAALFDNFLDVGLYDEHGGLIQQLISYSGPASTSTFQLPALTSNTTHTLSTGIYCLRAGLRNDGSVTMGMAIEANISGAGLIEPGCCNPYTIISGTVFEDTQCDSINNLSIDPGIVGATVSLCPIGGGSPIMTTTTDALGYYAFFDVPVGNYLVKQTPLSGYDISLGEGGISVTMNPNSVVGDIDFGNCEKCCAESDELTNVVISTIGASSIICKESGEISILKPDLLECQHISRILWGDGEVDILLPGDPIPYHKYKEDGVFIISVEVISATPSGIVCQVDVVDIPIVIKNCKTVSVNDVISEPKMKVFPVPAKNRLNIILDENTNGNNVKIFNKLGQLVLEHFASSNSLEITIDIDQIVSGVYYLQVTDNLTNRKLESRFIKI